jgi:hypothetical protein
MFPKIALVVEAVLFDAAEIPARHDAQNSTVSHHGQVPEISAPHDLKRVERRFFRVRS